MRDRWKFKGWTVAALLLPALALAQTPAGTRLIVNTISNSIKVNIGGKAPEPSVRVLDENGRPVADAAVTFTIIADPNGPGATFPNSAKTLRVTTDARGDGVAHGLRPNQVIGRYRIEIQAQKAMMLPPETPVSIAAENALDIQRLVMTPGDTFENNICKTPSGELKVQVKDERGNPVTGAAVTFRLPADGASGVFTGGSTTRVVTTDDSGQAATKDVAPNKIAGDFAVEAVAALANLRANAVVPGSNTKKECSRTAIYIAVGAAVLGGVGAAVALGGKGSNNNSPNSTPTPTPTPTPTITIGSGGDPRFGGH